MDRDHWQKIDALLDRALDIPAGERAKFLDGLQEVEPEVRAQVVKLLAHGETDDLLERPGFRLDPDRDEIGVHIGPYQLVEILGRGGMGTVYLAVRSEDFHQEVALKLIKRGMDSDEILRRFQVEREILARLEHPAIARLFDGGTRQDGRPYFVMERVNGQPIDRYCDTKRLSIAARLGLFVEVCRAVEAAHRALVIHRDLKPSNILVTAEGAPKLLDFGIAKLLDPGEDTVTAPRNRRMTLQVASPEQVRGEPVLSTASDVYSLGVLLHQLLSGRHPLGLESLERISDFEVIDRVLQEEPVSPSEAVIRSPATGMNGEIRGLAPEDVARVRSSTPRRLQARLAGDLDAIVAKALAKEPAARFGSARELADDVLRHLACEPVAARQASIIARMVKWIRRNHVAVMMTLVAVLAALVLLLWRDRVEQRNQRAVARVVTAVIEDLLKASSPNRSRGRKITADEILDASREDLETITDPAVRAQVFRAAGRTYLSNQRFAEAADFFKVSTQALRQLGPSVRQDLAAHLNYLGRALFGLKKFSESQAVFDEALEIRREMDPVDIDAILTLRSNLASILEAEGRLDEARAVLEEVLAERRRLGAPPFRIAKSLHKLGKISLALEESDLAERYLRAALAIRREVFDPEHTDIASTLVQLGRALASRGEHPGAFKCWHEAADIASSRLGRESNLYREATELLEGASR